MLVVSICACRIKFDGRTLTLGPLAFTNGVLELASEEVSVGISISCRYFTSQQVPCRWQFKRESFTIQVGETISDFLVDRFKSVSLFPDSTTTHNSELFSVTLIQNHAGKIIVMISGVF